MIRRVVAGSAALTAAVALAGAVTVAAAVAVSAAALRRDVAGTHVAAATNVAAAAQEFPYAEYDGRFTFVRVQYDMGMSQGRRGRGGNNPPWYHDYPTSDRALSAIISEVTLLRTSAFQTNIMRLDDPDIFRFPILYLSEPGYWNPTDEEVAALHAYLTKGGFIIFDDFGGSGEWQNFAMQMKRVMPELTPLPLDGSEPMWRTFFETGPDDIQIQSYRGIAQFLGFFEDNNKSKRQLAVINYNNDLGEIMEYSGTGFVPVDMSNEAFKLGVNFIIYAVTH